MSNPAGSIRVGVDLRGACQSIRDQGDRATCLACATSDAHAMFHGCAPLSAEFLFFHAIQMATVGNLTDGITFDEAAAALRRKGQPAEQEWPYSPKQPSPWVPPAVTKLWHGGLGLGAADAATLIVHLLKDGQPAVLGVRMSAEFLSPAAPNFVIPAAGAGFGGHAVLVVGLGRASAGQQHLLIRNSWGNSWGDAGHAWLAVEYLNDKLIGFASVGTCPQEE
ncbi:MAG: C1 family peptidase [Dongiaceae bacterium]